MKIYLKRLIWSIFNAFEGIKYGISQQNFFLMILLAVGSLGFGFWLKISYFEWLLLIIVIGFILSLEMLNTVMETTLDFIEPNKSPKIKQIKDIIAGSVFIACLTALIFGAIIFLPKIFALI